MQYVLASIICISSDFTTRGVTVLELLLHPDNVVLLVFAMHSGRLEIAALITESACHVQSLRKWRELEERYFEQSNVLLAIEDASLTLR